MPTRSESNFAHDQRGRVNKNVPCRRTIIAFEKSTEFWDAPPPPHSVSIHLYTEYGGVSKLCGKIMWLNILRITLYIFCHIDITHLASGGHVSLCFDTRTRTADSPGRKWLSWQRRSCADSPGGPASAGTW